MSGLLDLPMAELALAADRRSVLRGVRIVVTPEAPVRGDVTLVVGVGAPRHLHGRKYVPPVHIL